MKVEIYSKPTCLFCNKAKEWFKQNNIDYVEKDITINENKQELKEKIDFKTVPQIFIDDEYIGGYDDLIDNQFYILM
mgnify:CR=1 FL=1